MELMLVTLEVSQSEMSPLKSAATNMWLMSVTRDRSGVSAAR